MSNVDYVQKPAILHKVSMPHGKSFYEVRCVCNTVFNIPCISAEGRGKHCPGCGKIFRIIRRYDPKDLRKTILYVAWDNCIMRAKVQFLVDSLVQ